jgi:hypothetical protein
VRVARKVCEKFHLIDHLILQISHHPEKAEISVHKKHLPANAFNRQIGYQKSLGRALRYGIALKAGFLFVIRISTPRSSASQRQAIFRITIL